VASVSFVIFGLVIRMMDEVKDFEVDKKLFPERALPRGAISCKELLVPIYVLSGTALFLNIFFSLHQFLACLAVVAFSFLMYKWFFIESVMKKSLPLAFISHHPVVPLQILYLFLSFYTWEEVDFGIIFMTLPYTLILTHWEFARKTRHPSKETEYTTYSKLFGYKKMLAVLFLLQLSISIILFHHSELFSSPLYSGQLFLDLAFVFIPLTIFSHKLKFNLKHLAEIYILFIVAATLILSY
jgi:4-hydroxybenzoate polyprenyltransferase